MVVEDGKLLLIDHDKYGIWLCPGGHVEDKETPDETAKRETLEETGIKAELVSKGDNIFQEGYHGIPRPFNANLHEIEEDHWHCDFLYLARKDGETEATHAHEHNGTKWFSREELEEESYDIPEYIRKAGKRAIQELS